MPSISLTPGRGLAVMLAGILGILYAPFYALSYFATEDGKASLESGMAQSLNDTLAPTLEPFLTFASPNTVYLTYGKAFTFVLIGWMVGLSILHSMQAARSGRTEKWGYRLTFIGSALAFVGSIGVYWFGSLWWGIIDVFFVAFMVPSLLLFGIGYMLFGIGTFRTGIAPRLGAVLLAAGGLPGIIVLSVVLGQLTLGLLLINLGWVVLGYALYSQASATEQHATGIA